MLCEALNEQKRPQVRTQGLKVEQVTYSGLAIRFLGPPAKGVTQGTVSQRIKYHGLSEGIKDFIAQELLDEGHLKEITQISLEQYFSPWLTTEEAYPKIGRFITDKKITEFDLRQIIRLSLSENWVTG